MAKTLRIVSLLMLVQEHMAAGWYSTGTPAWSFMMRLCMSFRSQQQAAAMHTSLKGIGLGKWW